MALPTLLDIARASGSDAVVGLIDEAAKTHPELLLGPARTIKGLNYKTLVRTAVPTGTAFRDANEGVAPTKGTYINRLVEAFILNPRWECDKAVADAYEDGAEAYIALEGQAILEAAMQDLCAQFYYGRGTGGNAKGYPGLLAAYDAANMVVDAGGTTAATGSSVWGVRWGPKNVQWVWGLNGQLALADVREESILDAGGTNKFTAYIQEILARPGLQVASLLSIARIKKLTADSGKTLTDDMIADLLSKFPAGLRPDVLLMNRRSLRQLQDSRTATNATGAPAPFPAEAFGVPIAPTDAILSTEGLTL
ncbi:MAG TPA: hypothetical protein VM219_09000 [Phycisphaerae bacterium]|nr:hypothetical protein [Phycisphaerae bacterium]HUX02995.1 hypothetical protein [Phycisphaerae bacterium]